MSIVPSIFISCAECVTYPSCAGAHDCLGGGGSNPDLAETTCPPEMLGVNPKDLVGRNKAAMFLLPAAAKIHAACAMADGARKYGAYNWRDTKVMASVYVSAMERHLDAWKDGQELAADSGVHHLGHAIACAAILLDAQENQCLVDDRPRPGNAAKLQARVAGEAPPPSLVKTR
jgi:hypothetical protein